MLLRKTLKSSKSVFFPSESAESVSLRRETKHILSFAFSLMLLLALLSHSEADPSWTTWSTSNEIENWIGRLGSTVSDLMFQLFGMAALIVPLTLLSRTLRKQKQSATATFFLLLSSAAMMHLTLEGSNLPWGLKNAGGLTGLGVGKSLAYAIGKLGAIIVMGATLLASLMFLLDWHLLESLSKLSVKTSFTLPSWITKIPQFFAKLKTRFRQFEIKWRPNIPKQTTTVSVSKTSSPAEPVTFVEKEKDEDFARVESKSKTTQSKKSFRMPLAAKSFQLPSTGMLSGRSARRGRSVDKQWYIEKGETLVEKLNDFGVEGEIVNVAPGPVITVYEFKPASGIKIREIANLSDDLTLALSVLSVRIVAPIPGKPVVGIEIPTPERETVYFKDVVQETNFYKADRRIPIALGRLASGEPILTDLAAMPHLLVAGATGTGKSVFVNTLICSLLFRFAPQQLKLILVDPKMVELSHYEGIPHLLLPPVVDAKKAVLALRWLVEEMERRYQILHEFGVRHVDAYNARLNEMHKQGLYKDRDFLPYIVTVIDEYADLMAVVAKDVEHSVARLAQKARASGIHLVLATQRPSTDVVTGTIKANFPSRISFRVASSVDSKTILDRTGADRLLGNGDLLFHSAGFTSLKRMQGSFIEDQDIEKIIEHLKSQSPPEYNEAILEELDTASEDPSGEGSSEDKDNALYDAAVRLVTERGEASISLIQRHLRIGYNRAANLMDQLEQEGVVGQSTGPSKRRAVLVNSI